MNIIERFSAEIIGSWIPEGLAEEAREDIAAGRVAKPRFRRDAVEAVVGSGAGEPVRIRLLWEGGPAVACECGARGGDPCRHAAALALMLAGDAPPGSAEDEEGNRRLGSPVDEERRRRQERGASGLFRVRARQVTGHFGTAEDPALRARRALQQSGERKLAAARVLVGASLPAEALGLARDALALGCRALADRGDPGDDPSRLVAALYGELLPGGQVRQVDADAVVRASELARAFGSGRDQEIPAALVASVLDHAGELLARVRDRLPPGSSPAA